MSKISFKNIAPKASSPARIMAMYEAEDLRYKMQPQVLAANESAVVRGMFRVLIVADSVRSQATMLQCIRVNLNFTNVVAVDSVAEAIEKLDQGEFDVVVSAYRMSKADGTEIHKHIEDRANKPFFIIATDYSDYEAVNLRKSGIIVLPKENSREDLELTFKAVYTRFIDAKLARA